MKRGIDHLVLPVRDLDAAKAAYERFGFTTTPKAQHPFGTGNALVQLQGNFLELLSVTEPRKIRPPEPGHFSFGHFNKTFLEQRQGMSMLVFQSEDARADQEEFARNGLTTYAPFDFSRTATLPNGEEVTVAFSLAFVTDARMPQAAFFCCQQHAPQHFWKPAYQRHRNGAVRCSEVVMIATEPAAFAGFFAALQGESALKVEEDALEVATALGKVSLLAPDAFVRRFPAAGRQGRVTDPVFAAYQVTTRDLAAAETLLRQNAVGHRRMDGRLQIGPDEAFGLVIEMVEEMGSERRAGSVGA